MKFFANASSFSKKKLYISTPFFRFSIPFLGKVRKTTKANIDYKL